MREYITSEIERRRAELAELDQRRLILASEMKVLEDLLARAPDDPGDRPRRARSVASRGSDKARLSARWMPVLVEAVRRYPGTIRGEDAPRFQEAAGQEPSGSSNVRSHFWSNAKPGKLYERVGEAEYRATEHGARVAGLPLGGNAREDDHSPTSNSNGASHEPAPSSFENRNEPLSADRARFDLLNPNKAAVSGGGT